MFEILRGPISLLGCFHFDNMKLFDMFISSVKTYFKLKLSQYIHSLIYMLYALFSVDGGNADAIGKYLNDSPQRYANCCVKVQSFNGVPRLCIYSTRDIKRGEELRYDYNMEDSPWRADVCNINTLPPCLGCLALHELVYVLVRLCDEARFFGKILKIAPLGKNGPWTQKGPF